MEMEEEDREEDGGGLGRKWPIHKRPSEQSTQNFLSSQFFCFTPCWFVVHSDKDME